MRDKIELKVSKKFVKRITRNKNQIFFVVVVNRVLDIDHKQSRNYDTMRDNFFNQPSGAVIAIPKSCNFSMTKLKISGLSGLGL